MAEIKSENINLENLVDLVLDGVKQAEEHGWCIPPQSMWAHIKKQRELSSPTHS